MAGLFPLPDSLAEGRATLASHLTEIDPRRRKELGQCFTGPLTSRLLAALALQPSHRTIIDPMAGHGDLLEACAERASRLHITPELFGVEVDAETAALGHWRANLCIREFGLRQVHFFHGDAFSPKTWMRMAEGLPCQLVITNPPYVRYQTLSARSREADSPHLDTKAIRRAVHQIANSFAAQTERRIWEDLIASYSGLADLSVPSWLLCGILVKPGGTLALVVPQAWLNRDYARLARYFFLRFFQPQFVVEETGQRWFQDALVPVTLVVGRRLSPDLVAQPLRDRTNGNLATHFLEISSSAATSKSHVGQAFPGDHPEEDLAAWLGNERRDDRQGISVRLVPWASQVQQIFSECRGASWFQRLEGEGTISDTSSADEGLLPSCIRAIVPAGFIKSCLPLGNSPIQIGQGLRTGCNPFFYLDVSHSAATEGFSRVVTSDLFGSTEMIFPNEVLRPVVRRQREVQSNQVVTSELQGRLLDLRGWFLPEDFHQIAEKNRNRTGRVRVGRQMPEELASYVRKAARTQITRAGRAMLIPQLSAVCTNGSSTIESGEATVALQADTPRMWYMLPEFAPRHFPSLFIPRVIYLQATITLNAKPPALVDANFSTLWSQNSDWQPSAILALLNSSWVQLCMEAIGTPMGGGALKLESSHIRRLPVPQIPSVVVRELYHLGQNMVAFSPATPSWDRALANVNRLVVSCLAGREMLGEESEAFNLRLDSLREVLKRKRQRN